jgi:hypothetical protein
MSFSKSVDMECHRFSGTHKSDEDDKKQEKKARIENRMNNYNKRNFIINYVFSGHSYHLRILKMLIEACNYWI